MAGHRPTSTGSGPAGRRAEVLAALKSADRPMSIAEIADRLTVHVNTVRFHLDTLVETGQVERATSAARAPGRPPQLFQAVRRMDPTGPRHYRVLAEVLADALAHEPDPQDRALAAGRSWGRRLAEAQGHDGAQREPSARLVTLLDELGFAPKQPTAGGRRRTKQPEQIELHGCPFLEVATSQPHVACPVHLGMMQGALEAWDAPLTVDALEPFVEPDLCVARLTARSA